MTEVVVAADKLLVAERQQISVVQVAQNQNQNTVIERERTAVVVEERPVVRAVIQPARSPMMVIAAGRQGPPGPAGTGSGSGPATDHNLLANLNTGDFRHLTAAEYSDLTAGGESALHFHATVASIETAAGATGGHRMVILNAAGQVEYADALIPEHAMQVLGMTTGAAIAGGQVTVQQSGEITEPSWSWTMNQPVFLGTNGQLTQVIPALPTAAFSLVVGFPLAATRLLIRQREPLSLGE